MPREPMFMECSSCGMRHYRTTRNTTIPGKLELRKFCRKCRSHTPHKERKK